MSDPRQANQDEILAGFIEPWIARGREDERAAIVAWLVGYGLPQVANQIDNGLHLAGDDE